MPFRNVEGWMSEAELEWLFTKAQSMTSVIEVGCWKGRSTSALALGCPGKVYAVDHWLGSASERATAHTEAVTGNIYTQFLQNVSGLANVIPVKMSSIDAADLLEAADMVFIDAGHEYEEVLADIKAWRPKTKKLLCGHDYPFTGVRQAVHELLGTTVLNPVARIWAVEIA